MTGDGPRLGGGLRVPLWSQPTQEVFMSVSVGVDIGAQKHAVAICRHGDPSSRMVYLGLGALRLSDRIEYFNPLALHLD
jgi:hypothetical protein